MKKSTSLLLAALFCGSFAASAQNEVKITESINDDLQSTFKFNPDYKYYCIYLDTITQKANLSDDQYVYIGADENNGRYLDVWSNTFTFPTPSSFNSFLVPGNYMSYQVGDQGWSGGGYRVGETATIDLSGITSEYYIHFAVSSRGEDPIDFKFGDGHERYADIVLGDEAYGDAPAVGNFERNGDWYSVDIPMSYLEDEFGLNFSTDKTFGDNHYILQLLGGGNQGFTFNYDAVFFYGPKVSTGIKDVEAVNNQNAPAIYYTTDGKLVSKQFAQANKGVYVVKQGGKTKKVAL